MNVFIQSVIIIILYYILYLSISVFSPGHSCDSQFEMSSTFYLIGSLCCRFIILSNATIVCCLKLNFIWNLEHNWLYMAEMITKTFSFLWHHFSLYTFSPDSCSPGAFFGVLFFIFSFHLFQFSVLKRTTVSVLILYIQFWKWIQWKMQPNMKPVGCIVQTHCVEH